MLVITCSDCPLLQKEHNVKTGISSSWYSLRWLHTVSWKVENTRFRSKILYIYILFEEWNKLSAIEQLFENQKLNEKVRNCSCYGNKDVSKWLLICVKASLIRKKCRWAHSYLTKIFLLVWVITTPISKKFCRFCIYRIS